ncbi:redoxin domain-containing protein [Paenibacillus filicis]|uniref:Redoxin domain-containing protein n=1 Tax=Paenibacillus filicis TaxID=669464 RepID=A0ABU9DJD4_9BACL
MTRKRTWNWIVAGLIIVLLGVTVYRNLAAGRERAEAIPADTAPEPGFASPPLRLQSLEGKEVSVGGPREKPLVLNYWASWCKPCEKELPDLQALYAKYGDRLDIYGVNATFQDEPELARRKAADLGLTFPILLDTDGTAVSRYKIITIPTSFLIGKDGRIAEIVHVMEREELEKKFVELLKR